MSDLRETVRRIVEERELCSCMNSTKWNELRTAMMQEMPFQPPYIVKFLMDDTCYAEPGFREDVCHTGNWYDAFAIEGEGFHAELAVEWVKVRPRYLKRRGALLPPEVISAEAEFVAILQTYNIPYEESGGVYCIFGYR